MMTMVIKAYIQQEFIFSIISKFLTHNTQTSKPDSRGCLFRGATIIT